MAFFGILFTFFTLLVIASGTEDVMPKMSTPMTQLLLQDELHTAIRLGHSRKSKFKGRVVGKFITDTGTGNYRGTFKGRKFGKTTIGDFKYRVDGGVKMPGLDFKFNGLMHGNFRVHRKTMMVGVKFDTAITGSMHGKPVKGNVVGKMRFRLMNGLFKIKETGRFNSMVGGKKMVGKYTAHVNNKMAKINMTGFYHGKPFFVRYSLSASILKLVFGGKNPVMIRRNYGTAYLHKGGKIVVKKYDMKGWEIPGTK